jgi:predicted MFS family arabinose efflux permease
LESEISPRAREVSFLVLALLLSANLLNYIDRQVLYAVFPLIKGDFRLSDTALGFLGSAFMISYMVAAPFFGWKGAVTSRTKLASWGLLTWSLSTVFSGLAPNYRFLLGARTLVGIGEASFSAVSPALLSDHFARERRGRILSWFYLAIPVGSALGYLLGGIVGEKLGWHMAFLMVAGPGLILTVPFRFLVDPRHGKATDGKGAWKLSRYLSLFRNRSFLTNTLAMAAMTFALGGLAQWIPTFLYRDHHLDVAKANTLVGVVTVLAGVTGTLCGGWLGDRWQQRNPRGYLLVSGWGFLLSVPITVYTLLASPLENFIAGMFSAEFFLFLSTGPLNAVIANVTTPMTRTMAFAANIFLIHALGDAVSPTAIGWFSDLWGLKTALLTTAFAVALAAGLSFLCTRFVSEDILRAEENTRYE